MTLIAKVQNKVTSQIFLKKILFADSIYFTLFHFLNVSQFPLQMKFLKLKTLWSHVFY